MAFVGFKVKLALFGMVTLLLASCAQTPDTVTRTPDPMGDFKLGFVTVFADNVKKGPLSRDATTEELKTGLKSEMDRVFSGYPGTRFYNLAVSVETYILAVPGIPLVLSPKSALIVTLNVWDDEKGIRISEEHKQFTVLEKITGGSFVFGSGLTLTAEEQLAELNRSAALQIEKWLRENEHMFAPQDTAAAEG